MEEELDEILYQEELTNDAFIDEAYVNFLSACVYNIPRHVL